MTRNPQTNGGGAEDAAHTGIDIDELARDLFDKFATAQLNLLRMRALRDQRRSDEQLLRMRACGLLIACLPTSPGSEAHRLKVMATTALREEDGTEGSHAWLMCERALGLDEPPPPFIMTQR